MAVTKPYKYSDGEKHNQFCPVTYATVLAANTEQTLTVPFLNSSSSNIVQSSNAASQPLVVAVITVGSSSSVIVTNNATAAYPDATFSADGGEMVNAYERLIKQVKSGDVLHFVSNSANVPVNVAFYLSN